jgi:phospholipid/cholesterol/gamma-HCH transport system substrate-binding protein/paraquat-inducible protein B
MSERANYFKIGMFALTALGLGIAALIVFGIGTLGQDRIVMETYIDESVQGLDVGAPVKLRGVPVGQVDDILFVSDVYDTDKPYILVRYSVPRDMRGELSLEQACDALRREIDGGLRVRLASQGITGVAHLEADYMDPQRNPPLPLDWVPGCLYIPSAPNRISRLAESVENIMRTIESMEIDRFTHDLDTLIRTVNTVLERDLAPALADVRASASNLVQEVSRIGGTVDSLLRDDLSPLLGQLAETSRGIPEASARVGRAADTVRSLLHSHEDTLDETLSALRATAQDLNRLVEDFREYPAGALFADPPPPAGVEP